MHDFTDYSEAYLQQFSDLTLNTAATIKDRLNAVTGFALKTEYTGKFRFAPGYGYRLIGTYKDADITIHFDKASNPVQINLPSLNVAGRYYRFRTALKTWPIRPTIASLTTDTEKLYKRYISKLTKLNKGVANEIDAAS